jgi:hypothetical protein
MLCARPPASVQRSECLLVRLRGALMENHKLMSKQLINGRETTGKLDDSPKGL